MEEMEFMPAERIRQLKYRDADGRVHRRQLVGWLTDGRQILPAVIDSGHVIALHEAIFEIEN